MASPRKGPRHEPRRHRALIILAVVLLLFGSTRLPKLAKSLGQASKEFKKGVDGEGDDDTSDTKSA